MINTHEREKKVFLYLAGLGTTKKCKCKSESRTWVGIFSYHLLDNIGPGI